MSASPFLCGNYAPVADERVVHDLPVSGRLPAGLRGTLFRNGANPRFPPGTALSLVHRRRHGARGHARGRSRRLPQPLGAHAALPRRGGGRMALVQRLREAGDRRRTRRRYRSRQHPRAAGRLLALEEAHLPMRLDPDDLSTLGIEDFGGARPGRFTAHPKHDPRTGQLVFFGYSVSGPLSPGMRWGIIEADGSVASGELRGAVLRHGA